MAKTRILFLSEENESISFLEDVLSSVQGYETRLCSESERAVEEFRRFSPEITVVNLDREFSDSLLHELRDISPAARFLGFGIQISNISKSRSELFNTLLTRDALRLRFMTEVSMLKQQSDLLSHINAALKKIVGHSSQVKNLYNSIFKAIRSKGATVLIQGESGVGKELVAKAIASVSNHLISVNCSAISESLFESELFGHARGAFTGAITERKGLFEVANGGVLYLDEVGDIPLPVGSSETKKVKVQIVAATNHDLQKEAENGTFRKDLFYRLNVIPIYVPTLRERKEDIPELVEHFIQEFALYPDAKPKISEETMQALIRYDWPGNIRELENAIHRAIVLMNGNELSIENIFPAKENQKSAPLILSHHWEGIRYSEFQELQKQEEREFIIAKIRENNGSIKKTAESFGMQRPALYARASRVGLDLKTLPKIK